MHRAKATRYGAYVFSPERMLRFIFLHTIHADDRDCGAYFELFISHTVGLSSSMHEGGDGRLAPRQERGEGELSSYAVGTRYALRQC